MNKQRLFTNRLAGRRSLYLQQHAHNPVEWYPWGDAAIQRARIENKPILLSIGYSACHWCHVMMHESFEDPATADLMNTLFVSIKVDREERPDLDKIYQASYQTLMQQSGGWPLTLFLSPDDLIPFFGGTYFPDVPRFGLPPFKEVLRKTAQFYYQNRHLIQVQNNLLHNTLTELAQPKSAGPATFHRQLFKLACENLSAMYDSVYGGFGHAPKFPQASFLYFLWHQALVNPAIEEKMQLKEKINFTLNKMALGGLQDHIGGGFFRYTVDEAWQIPHFEKMLYDNAQLIELYAITNHKRTAHRNAEWVLREMQTAAGNYGASIDADSENKEGNFYCWTVAEVKQLLTPEEFMVFAKYTGLCDAPNFADKWHLHLQRPINTNERAIFNKARQKLFLAREQRIHPEKNKQTVIAWNGLMIRAMAIAGRYLRDDTLIISAQRAVDFIYRHLWNAEKKCLRHAFLDDYAFLLAGIIELLQSQWRTQDLQFAIALAEGLIHDFYDDKQGGFYFTSHHHEPLIQRPKPLMEEAIPAGNGVVALVLGRLGYLLAEPHYLAASEKTLTMAWPAMQQLPHLHTTLLLALHDQLDPPQIIILRGNAEALRRWQQRSIYRYHPQRLVFAIPNDAENLPASLANKVVLSDECAYVCKGHECTAVLKDFWRLYTYCS